jgi:hypothetical protein
MNIFRKNQERVKTMSRGLATDSRQVNDLETDSRQVCDLVTDSRQQLLQGGERTYIRLWTGKLEV